MRQAVDVLAVFDIGAMSPRPIRFKVVDHGIKKTVRITDISNIEDLRKHGLFAGLPESAQISIFDL